MDIKIIIKKLGNLKNLPYICDCRYSVNFLFIAMEQELNIELLENQDCCFTAVDSTRIPLDSNNKVNRAYIEFVVKDSSIVYNIINEAVDESDVLNNTIITPGSDGLFKYYKIVIPTLEYYRAGDSSYSIESGRFFYIDQKIYKVNTTLASADNIESSCTQLTSIMDLWNSREEDNNIYYAYKEFFSICRIKNCYLNRVAESISNDASKICNSNCGVDGSSTEKRDFMLATLYVLEYLISIKDYDEANRILNIILTCDDYLCPQSYSGFKVSGGCNCGK